MTNDKKIAVVTGSSSGIGYTTSLLLARNGFYTYATMRNIQKGKELKKITKTEKLPLEILELDVNKETSVKNVIKRILKKNKKIDVLVNNAGYGLFGALEDMPLTEIKRQYETNLFGTIRTIKEVLPSMRKQRKGIIVNISSIAGIVGIPAESIYASSKFAVEGLSESLSYELEEFGIKVILIEPGVINTNFVPNIKIQYNLTAKQKKFIKNKNKFSYSTYSTIDHFLSIYYTATSNAPHSVTVSDVIMESIKIATNSPDNFFRYVVGNDAKALENAKKKMTDSELHKYISQRLIHKKK